VHNVVHNNCGMHFTPNESLLSECKWLIPNARRWVRNRTIRLGNSCSIQLSYSPVRIQVIENATPTVPRHRSLGARLVHNWCLGLILRTWAASNRITTSGAAACIWGVRLLRLIRREHTCPRT